MRPAPAAASCSPAALLGLMGSLACAPLAAQAPACVDGTQQSFAATGSLQTYSVPANATAVYIVANGASGGDNSTSGAIGGYGAHIEVEVPVSGAATLNVLVGTRGASVSGKAGAGGGGGSFVYTTGSVLLIAAGGGGGASLQSGTNGQVVENGRDGDHFYGGTGGTAGSGGGGGGQLGAGAGGGGGGGFLGAGSDGAAFGGVPGLGGHRVSSPGEGAGGAGGAPDGGAGGFGGGGGGGASANDHRGGGGGGGGYSGGGGGTGWSGGGGSFLGAGYTFYALASATAPGDGSVTICTSRVSPPAQPRLTIAKHHAGSFTQGDTGQQYTITVANTGSAATSGPVGVIDTLPAGLVATGIGGPGWTGCTATPVTGPASLACSRSDPLGPGGTYPDLALTVSVNGDAPGLVINSAQAAGGGVAGTATADDPTTIQPTQPPMSPDCTVADDALCLNGRRFRVTATFGTGGSPGTAHGVAWTGDTGYFWFFSSLNVEVVVKVLDGCGLGGHYWVFAAGLTNVQVVLTVSDTVTKAVKTYTNPPNTAFAPIQDTAAFATCP